MKWKRMVEKCEPFATSMPSISRPSGTRGGRALIEMLMALPTTGGRANDRTDGRNGLAGSDKNAHDCVLLRAGIGADNAKEGPYRGLAGVEGRKGIPCMIRSRSGRLT